MDEDIEQQLNLIDNAIQSSNISVTNKALIRTIFTQFIETVHQQSEDIQLFEQSENQFRDDILNLNTEINLKTGTIKLLTEEIQD